MKRNYNHLPGVAFSILMALSLKERHGYEIIKQVEEDSAGKIKLGPGALYTSIRHLNEKKLIEEVQKTTDTSRRYYKLTRLGRSALNEEINYYASMVNLAKQRHIYRSTNASQSL